MPTKSLFSKVSLLIIGEKKAKVKGKSEKKAKINTIAVREKEKKTTKARRHEEVRKWKMEILQDARLAGNVMQCGFRSTHLPEAEGVGVLRRFSERSE